MNFLNTFGTHYQWKNILRSRYAYEYKISNSDLSNAQSSGVDLGVSAGIKVGMFSAGASASPSQSTEQASNQAEKLSNKQAFSGGSKPPQNNDSDNWAYKSKTNPAPISISHKPIYEIITPTTTNNVDADKIQANLKTALDNYCRYLMTINLVAYCNELQKSLKSLILDRIMV